MIVYDGAIWDVISSQQPSLTGYATISYVDSSFIGFAVNYYNKSTIDTKLTDQMNDVELLLIPYSTTSQINTLFLDYTKTADMNTLLALKANVSDLTAYQTIANMSAYSNTIQVGTLIIYIYYYFLTFFLM
jgi:hypothetical protein